MIGFKSGPVRADDPTQSQFNPLIIWHSSSEAIKSIPPIHVHYTVSVPGGMRGPQPSRPYAYSGLTSARAVSPFFIESMAWFRPGSSCRANKTALIRDAAPIDQPPILCRCDTLVQAAAPGSMGKRNQWKPRQGEEGNIDQQH